MLTRHLLALVVMALVLSGHSGVSPDQNIDHLVTGAQKVVFSRHLTATGYINGTMDVIGDYSTTSIDTFFVKAGADTTLRIEELIMVMADAASGFKAAVYGATGDTLAVGIRIVVFDADTTVIVEITGGHAIVKNADYAMHTYETNKLVWDTPTTAYFTATWDFPEHFGQYIRLTPGQFFGIIVNDDLTGLNEHHFMTHGYIESP